MRELDDHLYVSKEASQYVRNTIDRIYLEDNYHCCTTTDFEVWHVGTCCPYLCDCSQIDGQRQKIFCGDFWQSKSLRALTMKGNDFLSLLRQDGAASCVLELRRPHMIWAHGNAIYNHAIPEQFAGELVRAAKAKKLYSKPPVLGIYVNTKISA